MKSPVLKLEKIIKADQTRLFRAWLKGEDFGRWFLAGENVELGTIELDPRPGGRFRIDMIVDGIVRPHEGEYQIIEEPNKLVFTWRSFATANLDTLVTITFQTVAEGTLLTLVHEHLVDKIQLEMHNDGWASILTGLQKWQME